MSVDYLVSMVLTQVVMPLGMGSVLVFGGAAFLAVRNRTLGLLLVLVGLSWMWVWAALAFSH